MSGLLDTVPKQEVDDIRVMDVDGASNRLNTIGATLLRPGAISTSPHLFVFAQQLKGATK